jgi:hypothetical protein
MITMNLSEWHKDVKGKMIFFKIFHKKPLGLFQNPAHGAGILKFGD